MRRRTLWLSTLVCAMSLISLPATAGQGQGNDGNKPGQGHGKADVDHGHGKKKAKGYKHAKRHAAKRDDDRTRFRGLDRNHDNAVSRAEWDGDDRSFAQHDWNRDGVLTGAEIDPGAARPVARAVPRPTDRATRPRTESDEVLFARRDANHDQRLSRSEWTGEAGTFERLDKNKDGWLSPYEFGVGR